MPTSALSQTRFVDIAREGRDENRPEDPAGLPRFFAAAEFARRYAAAACTQPGEDFSLAMKKIEELADEFENRFSS